MMRHDARRLAEQIFVLILLLLTAVVYIAAINHNHLWWGDFSLYIGHARNIASLAPYADTGFIPNPDMFWHSPTLYPPVYPFLLSPVYALSGLNLFALKIPNIVLFTLSLWVIYRYAGPHLQLAVSRLGIVLLLAISPWFWSMKDLILSDIAFVFFVVLTIYIADRLNTTASRGPAYWAGALLLGICCYLAYGTREIGLALPIAIILADIARTRSIRPGALLAVAVFACLALLQGLVLNDENSYSAMIVHQSTSDSQAPVVSRMDTIMETSRYLLGHIGLHIKNYSISLQDYWSNGINTPVRLLIALLTSVLALIGYVTRIRQQPSTGEFFVIVYVGALLVLPFFQGNRYLLPLIPFLLFYIFKGLETLAEARTGKIRLYMPYALLAGLVLSHASFYATARHQELPQPGVRDPDATALFDFIKTHTEENSLILFDRPRVLALFTQRRSTNYSDEDTTCELWDYIKSQGITHFISSPVDAISPYESLQRISMETPGSVSLLFENATFRLYRVMDYPVSYCN